MSSWQSGRSQERSSLFLALREVGLQCMAWCLLAAVHEEDGHVRYALDTSSSWSAEFAHIWGGGFLYDATFLSVHDL